jgi:multidrug efflux system membrane fusion protein
LTRNEIDQPKPGTERPVRHDEPGRNEQPGWDAPPRSRTRRGLSFIGTTLTVIIIGAAVFYAYKTLIPHGEKLPQKAGAGGPPPTVGVATIGRGDIEVDVEALGTVTPIANITVKTQINGVLTEVGFKEGQMVKAGDFLAQIDPRPYLALLHQYEGQLAHDQGLLDEAIVDDKRYATLLAQTSIARQQAEDQKYVVEQDQGQVQSDKGLIEAQKVNLAFCHITAPVTGRVGLRQVDPGNYVQTSDTNGIVVLTQLQPISVIFSIPENVIPEVADAQAKSKDKLQATAFDQADQKSLEVGRLETLDNTIDTTTGQLKARAVFENTDNHLYPNQFVNIHLKIGELTNVIVVPTAAVQRGTPGTFVYAVGADDKIVMKKIVLGPTQGAMVAVTSGLQPSDRVVTDGSDRLRDGLKVNVAGAPHQHAGHHGKP